jgi:coiled-coil domain-containing protein 12
MADDRRSRLKALAAKAGRTKEAPPSEEERVEDDENKRATITFRNYAPTDKSLDQQVAEDEPHSKRARTERDDSSKPPAAAPTSKSLLQDALAETKQQSALVVATTETVTSMAPKKINWDLKRDIQPKLDKLERRTQKAIVEMLKERLELEATRAMDDDEDDDLD